jgi:putative protease
VQDINDNWLSIDVKNRFETGDLMELLTPSGNLSFRLSDMLGDDEEPTDVAPGSGHVVKIPVPVEADPQMIDDFALLVRYLPEDPAT